MPDIFNQNTQLGGAFSAHKAAMRFSTSQNDGTLGLGLLVQNFQATYSQQVNRLWELESGEKTYLVVGRAQGDMGISRIIGPKAVTRTFFEKFSNACNAASNVISLNANPGACPEGINNSDNYTYNSVLINGLSSQIGTQDMLIQQQIRLLFINQSLA